MDDRVGNAFGSMSLFFLLKLVKMRSAKYK